MDPPLPVRTGYYIAIYQPPRETARMLISFVKRAQPGTTIDLETDHPSSRVDFLLQPLVNLEIDGKSYIYIYILITGSPFVATVQQLTPTPEGTNSTSDIFLVK